MIEIIPKPTAETPRWQKILFYFSIFFLAASVLSYFVLAASLKKLDSSLDALEEELQQTKSPEELALEKKVVSAQKKIDDFFQIINQRTLNSKIFEFLEDVSHPRAFFSHIDLNSKSGSVALTGQTESFLTLGQQLMVFKKATEVKDATLGQVAIGKDGRIDFVLTVSLNPEKFKPNYQF